MADKQSFNPYTASSTEMIDRLEWNNSEMDALGLTGPIATKMRENNLVVIARLKLQPHAQTDPLTGEELGIHRPLTLAPIPEKGPAPEHRPCPRCGNPKARYLERTPVSHVGQIGGGCCGPMCACHNGGSRQHYIEIKGRTSYILRCVTPDTNSLCCEYHGSARNGEWWLTSATTPL